MAALPPYPAPEIVIEPQYCPEAVIEWYRVTGEHKANARKRGLSNKVKKHLCALGWVFRYAWRKEKESWELRYQSPITGKNFVSLRMACKSLIQDGATVEEGGAGCASESVSSTHSAINNASPEPDVEPRSTTTAISSNSAELGHTTRGCKKTRMQPRRYKKRKRGSYNDDDEEYSPVGTQTASSEAKLDGKSGRLLRSSKRVKQDDEAVTSCGSSQRFPRTIVSWLIDNNVVSSNAKVNYDGVKTGRLFRDGINCDCCGKVFTLTRFEAHACSTKHRPSANIFLEDGRSLMDCQREALQNNQMIKKGKNKHNIKNKQNHQDMHDSICSICHYGGELMLCDRCPSSFHHSCLGLEEVPEGDWFCPQCCCKICNRARCSEDFADDVDKSYLVCDQCERKYHIGCLKSSGVTKLKNYPYENWFCNRDCENIFSSLQNLVGKPIPVGEDNLTWTLLKDIESGDIEALRQIESKLCVALGVMHECFEPVTEAFSGRDLVADVIFGKGSELNRLNFRGFYTVILERNDEVISVATLRIYGQKVAEVPLVATRVKFRRLGMCRILMNELEKQLTELGVEMMVLPAAHNVIDTWINSFGFERTTDSDKSQLLGYTLLDFQDTIMCHKPLKMQASMKSTAVWPKPCIEREGSYLTSRFASCITTI